MDRLRFVVEAAVVALGLGLVVQGVQEEVVLVVVVHKEMERVGQPILEEGVAVQPTFQVVAFMWGVQAALVL
tara:strand:- start:135 stop:350 length:216 start_codon:yes stop_codon:yes gene_type:complete